MFMDEDHDAVFGQHDVGTTWQRSVLRTFHREAEAEPVQNLANGKLRLCASAADARHHLRALFWGEDIGHS